MKRTALKRKTPLRSRRSGLRLRAGGELKCLEARCDQLLRQVVRTRDGARCRRGGVTAPQAVLEVHHIISRRFTGTRWLSENAILLSKPSHDWAHAHRIQFVNWLFESGALTYERLLELGRLATARTPRTLEFMHETETRLLSELELLENRTNE